MALLLVLVIGMLLRFLGVYPGYSPYHPDEGKAGYSSAWYMFINHTLDLPHYHYPALIPTVELVFLVIFFLPILWVKLLLTNPDLVLSNLNNLPEVFGNYIAGRSDVTIMYLSRYLTAGFGVLTMILTYLVGKRLFRSRLAAVLSTAVLAVNLRAVTSSQLDLPDAYAAFFLLLAFYILTILANNPSFRMYILSGFTVGLAVSTKLQFFSLLPFMLTHLYISLKKNTWRDRIKSVLSKNIFFAVFSIVITFILVNIGPLTHFQKFSETITRVSQLYGFGVNTFSLTGLSYFYHIILTPAVFMLSLLGIAIGLFKYRWATFLILTLVLFDLYYFLYLTRGWFYPRNFVSIIPFVALLAGIGSEAIWHFLKKYSKRRIAAVLFFFMIVVGLLFESTKNSVVHTLAYMQPWNITSMRQCIRQNVISGKTVAAHPTDKYILFSLPSTDVDKKLNFIPLGFESSYSLPELQENKADYALLGLDMLGDQNSVWWMTKANYWQKPTKISNNVFASLAAKELFASAVCSRVKPWQAVENNYVFSAVPPKKDLKWQEISREGFNQGAGNFKKVDGFQGRGNNLIWDEKEGESSPGALKIKAVIPAFPVVRWISPMFIVEQGKIYKVEGWVKGLVSLEQKKRDGFLRLDFYQNQPVAWDEATESLMTNLSPRYFGSGWKKLEAKGVAPTNAKFATVSFQVSNFSVSDFLLDDLVIYNAPLQERRDPGGQIILDTDVFIPNLGSGY